MTSPKVWGGRRSRMVAQDELCAAIGAHFRQVREGRGVTLERLAKDMGRVMNVIRWHEAGVRLMRADDLTRAAIAMGVAPRSLLLPHGEAADIEGEGDGRAS